MVFLDVMLYTYSVVYVWNYSASYSKVLTFTTVRTRDLTFSALIHDTKTMQCHVLVSVHNIIYKIQFPWQLLIYAHDIQDSENRIVFLTSCMLWHKHTYSYSILWIIPTLSDLCNWRQINITHIHSQESASGCNTLPTNLDAPAWNLQNIKDKYADQTIKNLKHPTGSMHFLC